MRFGKTEDNLLSGSLRFVFVFLILWLCVTSVACQSSDDRYNSQLEKCVVMGHTKLDASVVCLESLLKSNPEKGMIHLFLARNYKDLGKIDKAEREIKIFVENYPLYGSGREIYCKILMAQGDSAAALAECTQAIKIQPDDVSTRLTTAAVHEEMGNLELAESSYKDALKINSKDTAALIFLGSFYERIGRLDDAIQILEEVVKLKPDNYEKIEMGIKKLRETRKLRESTEKLKVKSKAAGQS